MSAVALNPGSPDQPILLAGIVYRTMLMAPRRVAGLP